MAELTSGANLSTSSILRTVILVFNEVSIPVETTWPAKGNARTVRLVLYRGKIRFEVSG